MIIKCNEPDMNLASGDQLPPCGETAAVFFRWPLEWVQVAWRDGGPRGPNYVATCDDHACNYKGSWDSISVEEFIVGQIMDS